MVTSEITHDETKKKAAHMTGNDHAPDSLQLPNNARAETGPALLHVALNSFVLQPSNIYGHIRTGTDL